MATGFPITEVFDAFQVSGNGIQYDLSAVDDSICRIEIPDGAAVLQISVIGTDINGLRLFLTQGAAGSAMPGTAARDVALGEAAIAAGAGGVITVASTRIFIPQNNVLPFRRAFRFPEMRLICLDFRADAAGAATRRVVIDLLIPD